MRIMKKTDIPKQLSFLSRQRAKPTLLATVVLIPLLFGFFSAAAQNTNTNVNTNINTNTNINVSGRVTHSNGQPVQRPSVIVKGTTNGVTGDDDGNYRISAPANATLVISAIDFATMEVKVNNQTTLNITLVATDKTLTDVVVVGYVVRNVKKM